MPRKQSVNLKEEVYEWVKTRAERHGITLSGEINVLLSDLMHEMEQSEKNAGERSEPAPTFKPDREDVGT
jgi:macrodomain Ter protein organizer (MatP/YcbG family)